MRNTTTAWLAMALTACLLPTRGRGDDDDNGGGGGGDDDAAREVGDGEPEPEPEPDPDRDPEPSGDDTEGCSNDCDTAFDGECDDGGEDSLYDVCALGSDCSDCGPRSVGGGGDDLDPRQGGACVPVDGDCSGGGVCCMSPVELACGNGDVCCIMPGESCDGPGACCAGYACVSRGDGPFLCDVF